jgi:hypothetical protein
MNPRTVDGGYLGVPFPPTIETLVEQGPDFLTAAFHAAGSLSADNRVIAVIDRTEFFGGGMGRKLLLSLEYAKAQPGLHTDLFVKFPRDFGDPLRALFGPLMEAEVRFALLSRRQGFPIRVPKCYFADYNAATTSGILITERIDYGHGRIEPCHAKCMDYLMKDPLGHYRALVHSMASLAGAHKSGTLGPDVDRDFPFDAQRVDVGARIPYTPEQLQGKLDKLRSFAAAHPQLLPTELRSSAFLEEFSAAAPLVLQHEQEIRTYLNGNPEYVALCHWNLNPDNAWFWTDDAGEIHAGLLDWGSVGQMNVAQAFFGLTCSAETDFLNEHKRELMAQFVAGYRAHGGPIITLGELALLYKLSVAVLGIAWILDAPSIVEGQIPDLGKVRDRYDPALTDDFLARAQLQILTVFLNEWLKDDIGAALRQFASTGSRHVAQR